MRSLSATLFIGLGLSLGACHSVLTEPEETSAPIGPVTAFEGGYIFDGETFEQRTLCISGRVILDCPEKIDARISLEEQYITPPFGDAHTHHFDGPFTLDWHRSINLSSGTFYAMNMTSMTSEVTRIRDQLIGPGNVDVASSLGGITGPESHPAEIYEALSLGLRSYEQQLENQDAIRASRRVADNAYFIVETPEQVVEKMERLLSSDPDHVKVYLRQSERYAEGWGKWGPGGGVDPALLPQIATLTEDAGKRLAVATSSISDFRAALNAGAFNASHVPCYQDTDSDPNSPYFDVPNEEDCLLTQQDADSAAARGLSTTFIVTEWAKDRPAKYVEWEKANIAHLRAAGATMVVGSNAYGSTLTDGLIAGVDKEFFSAAELLRVATMQTPKAIFAEREVGCLDPGCEASFIAFASDPIQDIQAIRSPSFLFKDGEEIDGAE